MTTYFFILILAAGIPFLLYCLWNFSRELRPRRSSAVLPSHSSHRLAISAIQKSRFGSQPNAVQLRHQGRMAS
jgi:dolichyl-phosphate-mannose--protein O-mannosyl transferase